MTTEPETTKLTSTDNVLQRRAQQLAEPLREEVAAVDCIDLVTFLLGTERLAIATDYVLDVIRDARITPLPAMSPPIQGVTNLRGHILAVMSLTTVLKIKGSEGGRDDWIIVIGTDEPLFGIQATAVHEVVSIPRDNVFDPSRTSAVSSSSLVQGVTSDAMVVLDGRSLISSPVFFHDSTDE